MEKVTLDFEKSKYNSLKRITSLDYLIDHKIKIWFIGFLIRLILSPWLIDTYDYRVFRIPVAQGLLEGGALYNDVHYNHMPIYPYLTWLMVSIVGFENPFITSLAIKLPQTVADSLIPFVIFKIGTKLNKKEIGLRASVLYALNPIPIYEIMWATFHSIASLFLLLAFYYLLGNRPLFTGLFISLGFLTSQFPLFFFIIVGGYWIREFKKIILSFTSFLLTSASLIAIVLIPNGTSLSQMLTDLGSHPSYQATGQQCPRPILIMANILFGITIDVLNLFSILLFLSFAMVPVYYMIKHKKENLIFNYVVYEFVLLTIFFYCVHTKYILWSLPLIIFWSIERVEVFGKIPKYILIGYVLRRIFFYIPRDYHPNDISFGILGFLFAELILGIIGLSICRQIIREMRAEQFHLLERSMFSA
ncbi:MAG: hypothetical protein HeimC2_32300 [Candidatus Heimdallarchaeota archaeon LC_2]|nr:MAG: hypothetical protein HeimC2_32300 [Candidatus Heimdallarchaeota archaeon LC_2]